MDLSVALLVINVLLAALLAVDARAGLRRDEEIAVLRRELAASNVEVARLQERLAGYRASCSKQNHVV